MPGGLGFGGGFGGLGGFPPSPLATPVRELILQDIEATLATISQSNGYASDVATLTRGVASPNETTNLPLISLLPVQDPPEYGPGVRRCLLSLTVRVWIDSVNQTGTVLEALIADVQRVLRVDPLRASLAEDTREVSTQYLYLAGTETLAGADVHFEVPYKTDINNPLVGV
jgi:hypothetical protein